MPSSTSNSDMYFQREIPSKPIGRVVWGGMALVLIMLTALEFEARGRGILPSRDLNISFWQNYRFGLDSQPSDTTVLFGASRVTFGFDQDTWEEMTGSRPYNLALHGASSLPMLHDYATNTDMNGTVICSISGGFTLANEKIPFSERIAKALMEINKNRYSFALRAEDFTGKALQSNFAILNPHLYSPAELIRTAIRLPARQNEIAWFHTPYLVHHTDDNQDYFINDPLDKYSLEEFDKLHDTALQYMDRYEPRDLDEAIEQINNDVSIIESRGGEVIFVRFPISRFFVDWERERFPRERCWDEIIRRTGCRGFHYLDNENTKNLFPPDGSHLMPDEAHIFTRELAKFVLQTN